MDAGLAVGRFVLGPLMAAHGAQKLFGWFGGHGLAGVSSWLESIGFRPGRLFALVAGSVEFAGGILITAGLFGPVGPAIVVAAMIVAAGSVHWPNVFASRNGIELPLVYGAGAAALALTGPGRYSLDQFLGLIPLWTSEIAWTVLLIGVVGGAVALALRGVHHGRQPRNEAESQMADAVHPTRRRSMLFHGSDAGVAVRSMGSDGVLPARHRSRAG